jgi:hypothetical protein
VEVSRTGIRKSEAARQVCTPHKVAIIAARLSGGDMGIISLFVRMP